MAKDPFAGIRSIEDIPLAGKNVFIRLDLNVPIKDKVIQDDTRILAALPTIEYAIDQSAKVILCSHLGRPKGIDPQLSLEPIGQRLTELLTDIEVMLVDEADGAAPNLLLAGLKSSQILLLENLRFCEGETKNDKALADIWAKYTDVYINDAFGASHRTHASVVAMAQKIPNRGVGFLIQREVEVLSELKTQPEKPYLAILGGAKVSDKISVIENLFDKVDTLAIGGAMAYTFLKAENIAVGDSLVENQKVHFAKELLERARLRNKKILLPVDHVVVPSIEAQDKMKVTSGPNIEEGWMGVDIGPETQILFAHAIARSKTVFWNGPMGIFEIEAFSKGSFKVAAALARSDGFTVIGGGDSVAAINQSGYADQVSHISTGGGASMEYLQGEELPGLSALRT